MASASRLHLLSEIAREITGTKWSGPRFFGLPSRAGREAVDRKLVVNEAEAETVRAIYRRYLSLASVPELLRVLRAEGVITKVQQRTSGPHRGGIPFARGSLFHLLKNRIYLGEIVHKGTSYPGDHEAIVPQQLWDDVRAKIARGAPRRSAPENARHLSLLTGLLHDGAGRPMAASHANKGAKRYRYYISLKTEAADAEARWRVGAHDVEQIAIDRLASFLRDGAAVQEALIDAEADAEHLARSLTDAAVDADVLATGAAWEKQKVLSKWLARIDLQEDWMRLQLEDAERTLVVPVARVRRGHDMRLVIPPSGMNKGTARDARLVELIAEAFAAREAMLHADAPTIDEVAEHMGYKRKHCAQLLRLSYLAPDIIAAILDGRQPASLTRARLTTATQIPVSWAEQKALFGIA